jgi:hypothetical protein
LGVTVAIIATVSAINRPTQVLNMAAEFDNVEHYNKAGMEQGVNDITYADAIDADQTGFNYGVSAAPYAYEEDAPSPFAQAWSVPLVDVEQQQVDNEDDDSYDENLGDDYGDTPWVPPTVEKAHLYKQKVRYSDGTAPLWKTSASDLSTLGIGVSMYFRFLVS